MYSSRHHGDFRHPLVPDPPPDPPPDPHPSGRSSYTRSQVMKPACATPRLSSPTHELNYPESTLPSVHVCSSSTVFSPSPLPRPPPLCARPQQPPIAIPTVLLERKRARVRQRYPRMNPEVTEMCAVAAAYASMENKAAAAVVVSPVP